MSLPPLEEGLDPNEVIAALARVLGPERCARFDAAAAGRIAGVTVLLEELHDPHNYGAVLRSCEAMGLGHVYTINARHRFRVSPRVTQGCEKWLDVHAFADPAGAVESLRAAGYLVLAAVPGAKTPLDSVDVSRPVALAFGNEHLGLSPALRRLADGEFAIPMHGMSQSLNVSVSVAVSISSATHARRRLVGAATDLRPDEVTALRARFYAADVRGVRPLVERFRNDNRM